MEEGGTVEGIVLAGPADRAGMGVAEPVALCVGVAMTVSSRNELEGEKTREQGRDQQESRNHDGEKDDG
jgi:hypothetical protein